MRPAVAAPVVAAAVWSTPWVLAARAGPVDFPAADAVGAALVHVPALFAATAARHYGRALERGR